MDRNEKILYHINKNGYGVEIGPSHRPIAPKRDGYKVHIIDHMTREQLIEKYKEHNVSLENIEDVDYVWTGESYINLTGRSKFYDWIIASHVIEHTPDLIGFLNDCDSIMKDEGVLSLVVPDSRYCFDYFRPITGISKIIDAHFNKHTIHTPGSVIEFVLNVVSKSGQTAWYSNFNGKYSFIHSLNDVRMGIDSVVNNKAYHDVHAWCFTPHSFRLMIYDLYCIGLIPFKEISFFPTTDCEFYITLGRKGEIPTLDRLEMLEIIKSEISGVENHADIETIIHDKDVHIRNLEAMIYDKDVHINNLENHVKSFEAAIREKDELINAIRATRGWRLLERLRRIRQRLLNRSFV